MKLSSAFVIDRLPTQTTCHSWHMTSHRSGAAVGRRSVLMGALALPLALTAAACSSETSSPATPSATSAAATADLTVEAGTDEWLLIARYDSTITQHPELTAELEPIRDQHREHASALGMSEPDSLPDLGPAPASRKRALALLAAAESTARDQRIDACVACDSATTARLLASIAASEASHAAYWAREAL